ncbi:hypothetical protein Kfla_6540 [Kribbella flavida DSM 17836]|uniref:Uncharacterized protein n=1 Tax=Kribbella flavida (strain DSM 17836 / JCM 10339 / NBRC 14399) TaxID=479435 RepID=D2PYG9_KRIFD|nr:hypothetical protein [Kribbella flavida]ADB35537.1 hypothetical protein Kfla_6540 [Kribbella flavida DSM 17836]
MTTITRPAGVTATTRPAWMHWAPRLTAGWAAAYGLVRVWFATGHAPDWKFPGGDLLLPDWASVAACVISALVVAWPASRTGVVLAWAAAAGWVAVCAMALLDVIGGVLPGLGIPFDLAGMLSRFGGLTGAALLAATALARQRQLDPTCLSCSGGPARVSSTPRWAVAGALVAVAGCLIRVAAQAAVGFDFVPYDAGLAMIVFEGGFLLAGIALPLLLVTRIGRVFPRWMLLLPGGLLGAGITAYFGVGLLQMVVATLSGEPVYTDVGLPASFFWVAVPAYLVWGAGLAVATAGYWLRTRKPCGTCGR